MIFSKTKVCLCLVVVLNVLAFTSCKKFKGDVRVPAYLHIDRFDIKQQSADAPSEEPGFYSSLVDAVQLVCLFEGDESETEIGTFQLPCTVPVLRHGTMKYLRVSPCVKQNGISSTRIYYPYYQPVTLNGLRMSPDSITNIGNYDSSTGKWSVTGYYYEGVNVLTEEFFETNQQSTVFGDAMEWVKNSPSEACTGTGYGRKYIDDTTSTLTFTLPQQFSPSKTQYLYLEMDYRNDVEMQISMIGYPNGSASTSAVSKSVMMLYPNSQWQKIYINLGKTWSQFNYNNPITIYFDVVNSSGKSGYVRMDNFKIIAI